VIEPPVWLTWVRLAAPRPNWLRYALRSLAAFGLAYASTMATFVVPSRPVRP
jgi:hypothetical protein